MEDEGISSPLARDQDTVRGRIWSKQEGRVAGVAATEYLLRTWLPGATWEWVVSDGADISPGKILIDIEGGKEQILAAERVILNLLGRLSGIATNTKNWTEAAGEVRVASTRKTHWGLLDKWAVHIGGGLTHRLTRSDALMLKENDLSELISADEKRPKGIARVIKELNLEIGGAFVVIETRSIDEAVAAAEAWVERMDASSNDKRLTLMLDNMPPEKVKDVVLDLQARQFRDLVIIEASGNIEFESLDSWETIDVDVVSASALHRGTKPMDLSMLLEGA